MSKQKYIPGSDVDSEEIFKFPYLNDEQTINFIKEHGSIMFIIRGPPGTGKNSLSAMVFERYPMAVECSADSYFRDTFSSSKRDPVSLRKSHEFCHKKVERHCQNSKHPIIVKNTHMKKKELQTYLNFAAEYNYTVIMSETTDKFEATPEVLAKSNTKGLSLNYFQRRLQQWEEVIPVLTGWFMKSDDSSFLISHLFQSLQCLLSDGKFCQVLNIFKKDELVAHYKARRLLYCIAACGENTRCHEIKSHYLSDNVKQSYGKCFNIVIQGYVVTLSSIFAIVNLDQKMKSLRYFRHIKLKSNSCADLDSLISSFGSIHHGNNFENYSRTLSFDPSDFKEHKIPFSRGVCEPIDISCCSFIQLAQAENESNVPMKSADTFFKLLAKVADEYGKINFSQFRRLQDNFQICRLSNDGWLIRPPKTLWFKTIYTGLYV